MHGTPLGRFGMVVVAAVVLLGCPRADPKAIAEDAVARVNSFAEEVCSCRDQACADRVQHRRDAWAHAHRAKYGDLPPADDAMKAAGERYDNCWAKAMMAGPPEDSASGPAPAPPIETPLPDIVSLTTPDALIAQAYRTASGDVFVSRIELRYITAAGTFDPQYSEATITMSRRPKPEPPDDPNRPTGAPVRDTQSLDEMLAEHRCPQLRWREGAAAIDDAACGGAIPLERPRCTVAAVAKRAVASGAPDKALAVIVLDGGDKPGKRPRWSFTIDDVRRPVHFETHVADDCEVVVEKP